MDIWIIVIDALRRDTLEIYGNKRHCTPSLDRFARQGVALQDCYSAAPWTLPSCTSILTGCYPSTHGKIYHSARLKRPLISDILRKNNFRTIAVTNNSNFAPNIGFQQHFDEYHFFPDGNKKIVDSLVNHEAPFTTAHEILRLDKCRGNRLIFFHTNIVHDYYLDVNKKYYSQYSRRSPSKASHTRSSWELSDRGHYLSSHRSDSALRLARSRYESGVEYLDKKLGGLLEDIDPSRSLVIIVSDHGEGFTPELFRIHHGGRLHNGLIQVPALLRFPDRVTINSDPLSSLTDITPTILDYVGLYSDRHRRFDGISLLRNSEREYVISEDSYYYYVPGTFDRLTPRSNKRYGLKARIFKDRKVIASLYENSLNYFKFQPSSDSQEINPLLVAPGDRFPKPTAIHGPIVQLRPLLGRIRGIY